MSIFYIKKPNDFTKVTELEIHEAKDQRDLLEIVYMENKMKSDMEAGPMHSDSVETLLWRLNGNDTHHEVSKTLAIRFMENGAKNHTSLSL